MTTPEIIDQIHELILEDRRISAKSIAEQLGISRKRVGSIIRDDLDTRFVIHGVQYGTVVNSVNNKSDPSTLRNPPTGPH